MQNKTKRQLVAMAGTALLAAPFFAFAQLGGVAAPGGTVSGGLLPAILRLITYFLILAGVVAVIYIILGGIKYITSQGEEDQSEEGKKTILYAVIGLIVIGLAAALVNFVIAGINTAG